MTASKARTGAPATSRPDIGLPRSAMTRLDLRDRGAPAPMPGSGVPEPVDIETLLTAGAGTIETASRDQLAIRLREMREEAGLTQCELATVIGVAQSQIARMESSTGPWPSAASISRFAHACGREAMLVFPRTGGTAGPAVDDPAPPVPVPGQAVVGYGLRASLRAVVLRLSGHARAPVRDEA